MQGKTRVANLSQRKGATGALFTSRWSPFSSFVAFRVWLRTDKSASLSCAQAPSAWGQDWPGGPEQQERIRDRLKAEISPLKAGWSRTCRVGRWAPLSGLRFGHPSAPFPRIYRTARPVGVATLFIPTFAFLLLRFGTGHGDLSQAAPLFWKAAFGLGALHLGDFGGLLAACGFVHLLFHLQLGSRELRLGRATRVELEHDSGAAFGAVIVLLGFPGGVGLTQSKISGDRNLGVLNGTGLGDQPLVRRDLGRNEFVAFIRIHAAIGFFFNVGGE